MAAARSLSGLATGHRPPSTFFASTPFAPNALLQKVPYLKGATVRQSAPNTLTVTVERDGPVQVSFFGYVQMEDFRDALEHAPPGIMDERSWAYWNVVTGRYPVPPMPRRFIP